MGEVSKLGCPKTEYVTGLHGNLHLGTEDKKVDVLIIVGVCKPQKAKGYIPTQVRRVIADGHGLMGHVTASEVRFWLTAQTLVWENVE